MSKLQFYDKNRRLCTNPSSNQDIKICFNRKLKEDGAKDTLGMCWIHLWIIQKAPIDG